MSQYLDWENIRTVGEVARTGTVRAAAKALGVHHTTVSRRIDQLEVSLGSRLFNRNSDGLAITPQGEKLVEVATRFSDDLIDVRRSIQGDDKVLSGSLSVTMAEPLFVKLFAPRLSEFISSFPDVVLNFSTGNDFLNMAKHEADVAIRMDNNPPETLVGKRLFAYRQSIYATAEYLSLNNPEDESSGCRWLGWAGDEGAASHWTRQTEFSSIPVWGQFTTQTAQQAACREGLGLSMLPCLMADDDPQLVRATKRPPVKSRSIWLLTHADLRHTARVRAFMEFAEMVLRDAKPKIVGEQG